MSGTNADVTDTLTGALPTGAAVGLGAFIVNYIVVFVFVMLDGAELNGAESWKAVGMVLFSAQQVPVEVSSAIGSVSFNILTGTVMGQSLAPTLGSTVPTIVYQIVPVLVLIGAGLAVAKAANARDPVGGAAAGATITVGYLILSIVGVVLFSVSQQGGSLAPSMVMGIVLAGIVYPLVGGAIGGAIGGSTN